MKSSLVRVLGAGVGASRERTSEGIVGLFAKSLPKRSFGHKFILVVLFFLM